MKSKAETKVEEVLKELNNHPTVIKLRQENKAKTLKKRQGAAEAIKRIEEEEKQVLPDLAKRLEEAEARVLEAEAKIQELRSEVDHAWQTQYSTKANFEYEKNMNQRVLLESYDERLDDDLEFFRGELDRLRHPRSIQSHKSKGKVDLVNWKKELEISNNVRAINEAIGIVREPSRKSRE